MKHKLTFNMFPISVGIESDFLYRYHSDNLGCISIDIKIYRNTLKNIENGGPTIKTNKIRVEFKFNWYPIGNNVILREIF